MYKKIEQIITMIVMFVLIAICVTFMQKVTLLKNTNITTENISYGVDKDELSEINMKGYDVVNSIKINQSTEGLKSIKYIFKGTEINIVNVNEQINTDLIYKLKSKIINIDGERKLDYVEIIEQ